MDGVDVLFEGVAELGFAVLADGDKKSRIGCLVFIVLACLIGWLVWYNYEGPANIKGVITNKLSNDRILLKTDVNEDVYTITHELYVNKKVGDTITIKK
jgi:hypothetical protein